MIRRTITVFAVMIGLITTTAGACDVAPPVPNANPKAIPAPKITAKKTRQPPLDITVSWGNPRIVYVDIIVDGNGIAAKPQHRSPYTYHQDVWGGRAEVHAYTSGNAQLECSIFVGEKLVDHAGPVHDDVRCSTSPVGTPGG